MNLSLATYTIKPDPNESVTYECSNSLKKTVWDEEQGKGKQAISSHP